MEIKRDAYLNRLISKKHNGLIKVVTGIRRCVKSYLSFTLFKERLLAESADAWHIIDMAFYSSERKRFREPNILYPYLKNQILDGDMYYILLDEVQLLDDFESVLNSLVRIKQNYHSKYIGYLCDSFLIDRAVKQDIRGKKYVDTPSKYYFTDMGLRNARLNFRQMEETRIMENIIFNELKIRGYNIEGGLIMSNEKTVRAEYSETA